MDCSQPIPHLDVAIFKDRTDFDRELFAACIALVRADAVRLPFQGAALIDNAAMGTDATVRPKSRFDKSVSGGFIIELRFAENRAGHGKISLCHNPKSCGWSRQV